MKTEIEEYFKNCDKCFENKPKLLTDRPELHPIPIKIRTKYNGKTPLGNYLINDD